MIAKVIFTMCPTLERKGGFGTSICTSNEALMAEVANLGYDRNSNSNIVTVEDQEGSPKLEAAFVLIRKHLGMERSPHKTVRAVDRAGYFAVRMDYAFTPADVEAARLLRAFPHPAIATVQKQLADETYVVEADQRLRRSKCGLGNLYLTHMGCDEATRELLESANLRGLTFRPILIEPPGKTDKKLWALWSSVRMPECLWPLVDGGGEPFTGDFNRCCFYDTPDSEARPRWREKDVSRMEPFDAALTLERTGQNFNLCSRHLIVSQYFRSKLIALGVKNFVYTPVELL